MVLLPNLFTFARLVLAPFVAVKSAAPGMADKAVTTQEKAAEDEDYPRPLVTVDIKMLGLREGELQVLLMKRGVRTPIKRPTGR